MEILLRHPYAGIAVSSFLVNIPCGWIREKTEKFSPAWFFWIHASIPLIIYLRLTLGTSKLFIPVCIALAVAGQIAGSRWRRKRMSVAEIEHLQRIPHPLLTPAGERGIPDEQTSVVLMNMGGPRTLADVREFLFQLFRDALLIRLPGGSWLQPAFAWILSRTRDGAARQRYALIGGGSPIYPSTEAQVRALQEELRRRGRALTVTFTFNYSPPYPADTAAEVAARGNRFVLPVSLYPHFSQATTGSSLYYLQKAIAAHPGIRVLPSPGYAEHPGYIQALAERVREAVPAGEKLEDFYLLFSAHGLPRYFLTEADPYPGQIARTIALVLQRLDRTQDWALSYQSAVGPLRWLRPYTEDIIPALARRGVRKLLVVPVSFVSDHIETLCEVDREYRELAESVGIGDYRMSRAVESHPGFIQALADAVESLLPGQPSSRA